MEIVRRSNLFLEDKINIKSFSFDNYDTPPTHCDRITEQGRIN